MSAAFRTAARASSWRSALGGTRGWTRAALPRSVRGNSGGDGPKDGALRLSSLWPAAVAGAALAGTSLTACDAPPENERPWPATVPEADIDRLVTEILNDPSINIPAIPDAIERRIYKSTIQLTISTFYYVVGSMNGAPLLAHQIHVKQAGSDAESVGRKPRLPSRKSTEKATIDDRILEDVADRLLANQAINFSMIPDALERQIYINCIKVIFRILTLISQSFALQVCGHEFRVVVGAVEDRNDGGSSTASVLTSNAVRAASSLSKVDMDRLTKFAHDVGVEEDAPQLSWWDSLFIRREFVAQMHASLYGLVLGIVDDVLANTKIRILNDELTLDIVPAPERIDSDSDSDDSTTARSVDEAGSESSSGSVGTFAAASFAAGVGVGVAAMAVLSNGAR